MDTAFIIIILVTAILIGGFATWQIFFGSKNVSKIEKYSPGRIAVYLIKSIEDNVGGEIDPNLLNDISVVDELKISTYRDIVQKSNITFFLAVIMILLIFIITAIVSIIIVQDKADSNISKFIVGGSGTLSTGVFGGLIYVFRGLLKEYNNERRHFYDKINADLEDAILIFSRTRLINQVQDPNRKADIISSLITNTSKNN
jgi:ABC-type multidrug transport system fused ATPase/permease subunit